MSAVGFATCIEANGALAVCKFRHREREASVIDPLLVSEDAFGKRPSRMECNSVSGRARDAAGATIILMVRLGLSGLAQDVACWDTFVGLCWPNRPG
jgi:hypothetical protein